MDDRYRQFFVEADTDKDGQLTLDELTAALKHRGYMGSDLKIKVIESKHASWVNYNDNDIIFVN